MFPLTRNQFLKFAAVGTIVALTAASNPARADKMIENLGPVGPHEPILATIGHMRVIAFYVPNSGTCVLEAVVWDGNDTDANSTARVRVSLNPGQTATISCAGNQSLTLRCGDYAETLAVVVTR